jgi:hypothetical protein
MQISESTLKILDNFSKINQNLMLKEGNHLVTINVENTVLAEANVEDAFPQEFGVYDLSEFLNTIAMFKQPELSFNGDVLTISDGSESSMKTRYYAANPAILTQTPNGINVPDGGASFLLTKDNFKKLEKGGNTLKLRDLKFVGKDGVITATVYDADEAIKNTVSLELTDEYTGGDFEATLKLVKMVILDGDYECKIIANRAIELTNTKQDLRYVISLDAKS